MSDDRKNPLWPLIAVLLIGLPVLYVASFGPACWIASYADAQNGTVETLYHPVIWAWDVVPKPVQTALGAYSTWGAAEGWGWIGDNYINWRDPHLQMQFRWENARRPIND